MHFEDGLDILSDTGLKDGVKQRKIGNDSTYKWWSQETIIMGTKNLKILMRILMLAVGLVVGTVAPGRDLHVDTDAPIEVLFERIEELVKGLEYSDKVAKDFSKMVSSWKDDQEKPLLVVWNRRINEAGQDYQGRKISEDRLAKNEEDVIKELIKRIQKEISQHEQTDDLTDVVEKRQANCTGYAQIFYVLGNAIGFSVRAISVDIPGTASDISKILSGGVISGHVANMVSLSNGMSIMVDLTLTTGLTKPFNFAEQFKKAASYWELKDENLKAYKRIQMLDRNGLLSAMYTNRGAYSRGSGHTSKAISEFTKAIKLNPTDVSAYENRARIYSTLKQYTKALSDYNKAIELDPKSSWAYMGRAHAYSGLCQHTKAITDFTKAMELDSYWASTSYVYRGFEYSQMGQHSQALSDYNKGIDLSPKSAEPYLKRALSYASLDKPEKAMKDLLIAVALDPGLRPSANELCGQLNLNLTFEGAPDSEPARTVFYFRRALELDPKDPNICVNLGDVYTDLGQITQAISDYTRAIEIDPMSHAAYNGRGVAYGKSGRYDKAMSDFNEAIEVDPERANAYVNRGNCYRKKGQYDKAILDYTKAIELGQRDYSAFMSRGTTRLLLAINLLRNRLPVNLSICEHAFSDLSKAIELEPKDATAYLNRGYTCALSGRRDQAQKDLLRAIELNSSLKLKVRQLSDQFKLNLKLN